MTSAPSWSASVAEPRSGSCSKAEPVPAGAAASGPPAVAAERSERGAIAARGGPRSADRGPSPLHHQDPAHQRDQRGGRGQNGTNAAPARCRPRPSPIGRRRVAGATDRADLSVPSSQAWAICSSRTRVSGCRTSWPRASVTRSAADSTRRPGQPDSAGSREGSAPSAGRRTDRRRPDRASSGSGNGGVGLMGCLLRRCRGRPGRFPDPGGSDNWSARARRPRAMRERTVPGGMSSTVGDLGVVEADARRAAPPRPGTRGGWRPWPRRGTSWSATCLVHRRQSGRRRGRVVVEGAGRGVDCDDGAGPGRRWWRPGRPRCRKRRAPVEAVETRPRWR